MQPSVYRYQFANDVNLDDVEASLVWAIYSVENLHGESAARLDAAHAWDGEQRRCVIDASTQIGTDLNRLFVGFLRRELGPDAFTVERIAKAPAVL